MSIFIEIKIHNQVLTSFNYYHPYVENNSQYSVWGRPRSSQTHMAKQILLMINIREVFSLVYNVSNLGKLLTIPFNMSKNNTVNNNKTYLVYFPRSA